MQVPSAPRQASLDFVKAIGGRNRLIADFAIFTRAKGCGLDRVCMSFVDQSGDGAVYTVGMSPDETRQVIAQLTEAMDAEADITVN